jgi:hypothetical protein
VPDDKILMLQPQPEAHPSSTPAAEAS